MQLSKQRQNEIDLTINNLLASIDMKYPRDSLLEIVKSLGIAVYLVDFLSESNKVSGVVDKEKKPPRIYLNQSHSKTRQTFTLAHELGHYILHGGTTKYRIDEYDYEYDDKNALEETEANYFAASLLVPKDKLLEILKVTRDISAIAKYFGVSDSVIKVRLNWIELNYG